MVELFAGADSETRGLLAVKGAQTQQVRATLFERDVASHDVDNVDPGEDFLNEAVWDLAACGHLLSLAVCLCESTKKGRERGPLGFETQRQDVS